jgi:molybdate/tungstate transport system substrate-binding protein
MFNVIMKGQININTIFILSIVFLFAFILYPLIPQSEAVDSARDVLVMYAGSLVKIFENRIEPSFHNQTGYNLVGEGKGSVQIANMILDGFRRPDVFLSADTLPIQKLIVHNPPLAHWLVRFASAEIVIAYNPTSPFAFELERASKGEIQWFQVLEEKRLKFRRTDPELDPKGYYTIIVAKLANLYYNDSTIKDRILGEDRNKEQIFPEEILKSILESGQIDAVAAYKHEAIAHGLPYITLPPQINLGDPRYSSFYNQVSYTQGMNHTIRGSPIFFSYTIPDTVNNINGAVSFAKYLISQPGKTILTSVGLNPIKPIIGGDIKTLQAEIKALIQLQN